MRHNLRLAIIPLHKVDNLNNYKTYENYNAINVDKVKEMPNDYYGVMGVPITYLTKHNPDQFDIVGFRKGDDGKDLMYLLDGKVKMPYFRVLIRKKIK